MTGLIISLISGAVGGNVAGALLKNLNLGTLGNSISGIVGGAALPSVLGAVGMSAFAPDSAGIVGPAIGGLVGGGGVMAIVGAVKNMMGK